MVKNLTEGKPGKLLFFFMLPMLLGHLFQQLYNMVDSIVVGKFVGESALAAVGSSFPVVFLAVTVAMGLSTGCTVVVSQFFGAQRIHDMKTTIYTGLISLAFIGLAIMAVGEIISHPLLRLLRTNRDIIDQSLVYLRIYFGGAIFLFLYNTVNAMYHALGDSKTPLIVLIISSLANIALDLIFVIYFKQGVAGVAWATLISQGMCALVALYILLKRLQKIQKPQGYRGKKTKFYSFESLKMIARIGIPSMIQQAIISIGMLFMQSLVNSYGTVFVAGYTAATKIDSLAMTPNMNAAIAMSTFSGQNIGARRYDRVYQGFKAAVGILFGFAVVLSTVMYLFGRDLLALFLNKGDAGSAMAYGLSYLKTVCLFYIIMGIMFVGNGLLRGAGDMKAFMLSTTLNLIARISSAYILSNFIRGSAIWWSIPIGWIAGFLVTFTRVRSGKWKEITVMRDIVRGRASAGSGEED